MGRAHAKSTSTSELAARLGHQRTPSLRRKAASEDMSSLRVVNVSPLPEEHYGLRPSPTFPPRPDYYVDGVAVSAAPSPALPSVFDIAEEPHDEGYTEPTTVLESSGRDFDERDSYSLEPPPPALAHSSLETLLTRFFSVDHLDEILRDQSLTSKFARFLAQYHPAHCEALRQYAEARKAAAAVEYANATAWQVLSPVGYPPFAAAVLDQRFESRTRHIVEDLVEEALPAYLTHRLVSLVTDTLVKEITGNSSPIMQDLIPSLAEVYCITDPSVPDNPIVYASEEFYYLSQHSKEQVIGRNCRFLQGRKTSRSSVGRMIEAIAKGEEICETVLNYRRDGSPFANLLMLAPLYDNKGTVRYFLGCQIDVSSLIEGGRGIESFAQLLAKDRSEAAYADPTTRDSKQALNDFIRLLSDDEAETKRPRTRQTSFATQPNASLRSASAARYALDRSHSTRIVLGMDDIAGPPWPSITIGPPGRVPGVYQNYLLVRPYPSLRITFTSPALRIPGLLQTKLLDRIGGSPTVREGLLDAFSRGTSVTAKISWLTSNSHVAGDRPRWIHCTPLFGSDDRVGVWMVVMVEKEEVTGSLNAGYGAVSRAGSVRRGAGPEQRSTNRLYADYLKREGRPWTAGTQRTGSWTREMREAEEHFRDF